MVVQKTAADEIRNAFAKIMSEPSSSRALAVEFLNSIQSVEKDGVDVLISGIKMPDIDIKLSSALTLGRVGFDSKEVLQALREVLEDDLNNSYVRSGAASALAQIGTPEAAQTLASSIRHIGLKNEDDRTFWALSLQEFASVGGLGLPHIKIFDDIRKDLDLSSVKDSTGVILSARREFSRALEGDFRRFVAKTLYQSPPLDHFIDASSNLIEVPEFISSLEYHTLVFDERVSFNIKTWNRGPVNLKADVRLIVLNPHSLLRKPTVIISRDEMTDMSLFMDSDDIAKFFATSLNRAVEDFNWAIHSSPGRDNGRLDGTLNSVIFDPTTTVINTVETELAFGKAYGPIKDYIRNNPNPPEHFYKFVVEFRQDLARRSRGH